MKVILHIGCEKTGTTTLQRFMQLNRSLLQKRGICYPLSPGEANHTKLAVAAISETKLKTFLPLLFEVRTPKELENFRADLTAALKREANGSDTLILSSEHCSSTLVDESEIRRLRDMLSEIGRDIRVVVYLRRQDDFLASNYSTQIRLGAVHKLQFPAARHVIDRYDYRPLLERWNAIFGDLIVRIYDRRRLVDGDIISDFLDACGVARRPEFVVPPNENVALGRDQIEFLRRLNKYLPLVRDGNILRSRGNIGNMIDKVPQSGGKACLSHEAARKFMAIYQEFERVRRGSLHWLSPGKGRPAIRRGGRPRMRQWRLSAE